MKKWITNLIVGVVGVGLIVFMFYKINNPISSSSSSPIDSGPLPSCTMKVYYGEDEPVINTSITFLWNEKLFEAMDRIYGDELTYREDLTGRALLTIGEYESDWVNSYFALYINGVYSTISGEHVVLNDGMLVEWVWTEV